MGCCESKPPPPGSVTRPAMKQVAPAGSGGGNNSSNDEVPEPPVTDAAATERKGSQDNSPAVTNGQSPQGKLKDLNRHQFPTDEKRQSTIGLPRRFSASADGSPSPSADGRSPSELGGGNRRDSFWRMYQRRNSFKSVDSFRGDVNGSEASTEHGGLAGRRSPSQNLPSIVVGADGSQCGSPCAGASAAFGASFASHEYAESCGSVSPTPMSTALLTSDAEVGGAYDLLDSEQYERAHRKLRDLLKKRSEASQDYLAIHFAASILHNLGGEAWSRPPPVDLTDPDQVSATETWLLDRDRRCGGSPCALLALSEYFHRREDREKEGKLRAAAAQQGHPLAQLRQSIALLTRLRRERDAGCLPEETYEDHKTEVFKTFVRLSLPNTRVAARAGTLIWVSYYRGTDGLPRDLFKAREVLERAIKYEMGRGNGKELYQHLSRVRDKIAAEGKDVPGGGAGSRAESVDLNASARSNNGIRRYMSTGTPRGSFLDPNSVNGGIVGGRSPSASPEVARRRGTSPAPLAPQLQQPGQRPPLPRGSDSARRASRSVSPSGLQRNSSVLSQGTTQTVVEVDVNGVHYGVLRKSGRLDSARRKKKFKVSDPNAETALDDTYDEEDLTMGASMVSNSEMGSVRSRRGDRSERSARRGTSISSRLRTENSMLADDSSERYRTHSKGRSGSAFL